MSTQHPNVAENIATGQTTVGATATLIAVARVGRYSITVENSGTTDLFVGDAQVTAGTGVLLPGVVGASITLNFSGALFAIAGSGSQAVSFYELY